MLKTIKAKVQSMPLGVKASVAYATCSILQRGLSLITMPLFTRLLTTEQYGQYGVYQSWVGILNIIITLNLAYGSFSTAMVKFEQDRNGYIASVQNISMMLAGIFLVLYLPFKSFWNTLLELPTSMVFLMVIEILANFSIACWYGVRRFEFKYKSVIVVTLLIAILSPILAFFLVINWKERGYARIFGYAIISILFGAVLFTNGLIKGKGGFNRKYWKYALGFNIPLIPYYLSQVIFNQSDRIMISHLAGTDKAGMYGIAYTLGTLLTFVLNAVNDSYVPWFYGKIKEGRGEENKPIANGIAILAAFLLLAVIALAPEVILILAGEKYMEAVWVVPPVAMSLLLLFYSQLFINVEFYYEEKSMLVWGSIAAAIFNVVLNYLLIPQFGFVAAGYTTLGSYVLFAWSNYYVVRYIAHKRGIDCNYYDLRSLVLILLAFAMLAAFAMVLYKNLIIRYAIILVVLLSLAFFYKQVMFFVKKILRR